MDLKIVRRYAQLREKKEELDKELTTLKESLITQLEDLGVNSQETDFGTFSLSLRKTWEYSKNVSNLKDKLELLKSVEEVSGIATLKETKNCLVYKND